jgi:hypothetical protein
MIAISFSLSSWPSSLLSSWLPLFVHPLSAYRVQNQSGLILKQAEEHHSATTSASIFL